MCGGTPPNGERADHGKIIYFKVYKSQLASGQEGPRNGWPDAGNRQVSWLLPGDDLADFLAGANVPNSLVGFAMSDSANSETCPPKTTADQADSEEYTIVRTLCSKGMLGDAKNAVP